MSLDILIEIDEGGISERSIGSIAGGGGLGVWEFCQNDCTAWRHGAYRQAPSQQ